MYDIDKTLAFLLIKARSQRAEDAFSLRGNAGVLIQLKQSRPPNNVAPSAIASEVSRLMISSSVESRCPKEDTRYRSWECQLQLY